MGEANHICGLRLMLSPVPKERASPVGNQGAQSGLYQAAKGHDAYIQQISFCKEADSGLHVQSLMGISETVKLCTK